jgi:hypothetical protein
MCTAYIHGIRIRARFGAAAHGSSAIGRGLVAGSVRVPRGSWSHDCRASRIGDDDQTVMPPSDDISIFQEALHSANNVVILAGAGLSAGSGSLIKSTRISLVIIQMYRDPHLPWSGRIVEEQCESRILPQDVT